MATKTQARLRPYEVIYIKPLRPRLCGSPQRRTIALRLKLVTPKKPNSARRPIVRGKMSCRKLVLAHIPGSGHNLRRHSKVLVCGVGPKDLPQVNYSCLRGVYDLLPLQVRRRRSVYGLKRPVELKTHVRRYLRTLL